MRPVRVLAGPYQPPYAFCADDGFGMEVLKHWLVKVRTSWNLDSRPTIFLVVTVFGAIGFSGVALALSAVAAVSLLPEFESGSLVARMVLVAL